MLQTDIIYLFSSTNVTKFYSLYYTIALIKQVKKNLILNVPSQRDSKIEYGKSDAPR